MCREGLRKATSHASGMSKSRRQDAFPNRGVASCMKLAMWPSPLDKNPSKAWKLGNWDWNLFLVATLAITPYGTGMAKAIAH
jgi:hypothetical protein